MNEPQGDLHSVERSINSVEAIRQVIGAVWTLARAQQQRVEAAAFEASAYLEWVDGMVARFAVARLDEEPGSVLWVVLGPERPFCGGLAEIDRPVSAIG